MSDKPEASVNQPEVEPGEATMRRAPKLAMFLVLGGGLGAVATFILTALYPADPEVGFGALFGYFALYGVPFGVLVGAVVALILDWRSRRKATQVIVEHESVHEVEPVMETPLAEPSESAPEAPGADEPGAPSER